MDVTIIKPFIESIWGHDLITGEKLTDFERGMQLVNAVVGAVTFGQGAMVLNFAEMSGKEAVTALVKIWAVDAVADMSAYTVGYACDELGMPAGITFLASLATGCTVSVKAGKYVFQDARGSIVKELDADGMWEYAGGGEYHKKLLANEEAEELAFNAIKGSDKADTVVLGKFVSTLDGNGNRIPSEKSYNIIAKDMGAQYFEIDNWNELVDLYGEDQLWKINEKFLDIQIASGREIYLSTDPESIASITSFYAKELQYLEEHGYRFIKEGGMWRAVQ